MPMIPTKLTGEAAILAVLAARRRARQSLMDYPKAIVVPGAPAGEESEAVDWVFKPVETGLSKHHRLFLSAIQEAWENRGTDACSNVMIYAPPGSAKSTYASVVAPTWLMGAYPGTRVILVSYATTIANKHSRRARAIAKSAEFKNLFDAGLPSDQKGVEDWALTNGSQMMSAGIQAGVTGNRAEVLIIDDPVAGQMEAESVQVQNATWLAYLNDLKSRLVPKSVKVLIMTRWSPMDLAGRILPEDYDGRSGEILGRDGELWKVVNLPAECERSDDPLGRTPGEFIWPEWFPESYFKRLRDTTDPSAQRTWSALYQQRPTPPQGLEFKQDDFCWYSEDDLDGKALKIYGASDYAVSDGRGDFTEHGIFGLSGNGNLYVLDWWNDRATTNVTVDAFLDLCRKYKPLEWFGERGVIESAIGPMIDERMRETRTYVARTLLQVVGKGNKSARLSTFRGMQKAGRVFWPKHKPWAHRVVQQLMQFPGPYPDDACDVCGLMGRAIAEIVPPHQVEKEPEGRKVIRLMDKMLAKWNHDDRMNAQQRARYLR